MKSFSATSLAAVAILAIITGSFAQQISQETGIVAPSKSKSRYARVFPYSHRQEFTTTREIIVSPSREEQKYTYPIGTKVRILFSYEEKKRPIEDRINSGPISPLVRHKILIGETQEQIVVPSEVLAELGGTPGDAVQTESTQPPTARAMIRTDGPQGFIWTGSPTGDENVPSSDPAGEQLVFQKLNALRKSKGLNELKWDEDLARGARYQAGDCYAQSYSMGHRISDTVINPRAAADPNANKLLNRGIFAVEPDIVAFLRFSPNAKGSNWNGTIFGGSHPRPRSGAFEGWVDSPGHYKNMLLPAYSKVGIGNVGDMWIMALGD